MSQEQAIRAEVDGIGTLEFPAGTDPAVIQQTVKRVIAERSKPAPKPEAPKQDSALSRFGSSFARNVLPSTTPSDYIEGPLYAAQHPIDSAGLLLKSLIAAHKEQGAKTVESAKGIINAPGLTGKLGALSETLGHTAATLLPVIGPAAANAGEQFAEGDIAGGFGAAAGLLTPAAASKL